MPSNSLTAMSMWWGRSPVRPIPRGASSRVRNRRSSPRCHRLAGLPSETRYSYVYHGSAEVLDHAWSIEIWRRWFGGFRTAEAMPTLPMRRRCPSGLPLVRRITMVSCSAWRHRFGPPGGGSGRSPHAPNRLWRQCSLPRSLPMPLSLPRTLIRSLPLSLSRFRSHGCATDEIL